MRKTIDCLLIGHNSMDFGDYVRSVGEMGETSCAYRDLNFNFLWFNNKPLSLSDVFNLFCRNNFSPAGPVKALNLSDTFSATISYLGTYLNRRGLEFDYIQSFQDDKEELAKKLEGDDILTIAITTTYYVAVQPIVEIIDFIKKYNHTAKIIVGGPFVATQIRSLEDPQIIKHLFESSIKADFYVNSSQGEETLVKIIMALKNGSSLHQVNNILYKTNGSYRTTSIERENNILNENMVKWSLFRDRFDEYTNIRTSISCPFSCAFCGFPEHAGAYQTADVEAIERELNELVKIESLKGIKFVDDTFNVPLTRFKEILRMIIRNNYTFKWISNFRCQYADRETVELMKESGCEFVFLGIEAGNDQVLKNMNKSASVKKYLDGIALLKEYGIMTFGSFIIGFPGETEETVSDTIHFIKESGIDFYRASVWYCERITPIYRETEKYNISGENFEWKHATMDSKHASDLVEKIFLTVKDPPWVPLYDFDIDSLWHLVHRGLSPQQINGLLKAFNNGIKEKLENPLKKEVNVDTIRKIEAATRGNHRLITAEEYERNNNDLFRVDFDLGD